MSDHTPPIYNDQTSINHTEDAEKSPLKKNKTENFDKSKSAKDGEILKKAADAKPMEGKSKNKDLKIYKNKKSTKALDEKIEPSDLTFIPVMNESRLKLVTLDKKETYKDHYVNASDILYKMVLGNGKDATKTGYASIPGAKIYSGEGSEKKEDTLNEYSTFETALGHELYNNGTVQGYSESIKDKCLELITNLNKEDEKGLSDDLKNKFTTSDPKEGGKVKKAQIAGAIDFKEGTTSNTSKEVIAATGNIREIMTIFMNLGDNRDKYLTKKEPKPEKKTPPLKPQLTDRVEKAAPMETPKRLAGTARSKKVQGQSNARGLAKEPFPPKQSEMRIHDENLKLTKREKKLQVAAGKENGQKHKVSWEEGTNKWNLNEEDDFVKEARELTLPVKAGPSGTTDRLFQYNEFFDFLKPEVFLPLVIAYILPINAHSLVEVMAAATPYVKGDGAELDMGNLYKGLYDSVPTVKDAMDRIKSNYPSVNTLLTAKKETTNS